MSVVCSRVALAPVYKGARGGRPVLMGRALSRIPTRNPIPSRFPTREERGKEGKGERKKERGAPPPSLVQFGPKGEGGTAFPSRPSLSLH